MRIHSLIYKKTYLMSLNLPDPIYNRRKLKTPNFPITLNPNNSQNINIPNKFP